MKIGDYVRTKYGIFKIRNITKDLGYNKREKREIELDRNIPEEHYNFQFYKEQSIFKNATFSPKIIDLIEVGDFVNGSKVIDIAYAPKKAIYIEDIQQHLALIPITNINRVVTKEQFESMQYRIGE